MAKITWSNEQLQAINSSGCNIIVSAGAGSGKTAVLTERIISKLHQGCKLNQLLVLTFTNAAAAEMKTRIINKMLEDEKLCKRIDEINSSYITTFDSYAQSLVRKYHSLLNVSGNIQLINSSIIHLKKVEFLDEIFNSFYLEKNELFLSLLDKFTVKSDETIKGYILDMYNKMSNLEDFDSYVSSYLDNFFNSYYLNSLTNHYEAHLLGKINEIKTQLNNIHTSFNGQYDNDLKGFPSLENVNSYKSILQFLKEYEDFSWKKTSEPDFTFYKENIKYNIAYLKDNTVYENTEEIFQTLLSCKNDTTIILEILKRLNEKVRNYKQYYEVFEFYDIAHLSLKLVKDFPQIRQEIKMSFNEILLDEYQDTNDLQEAFVKQIANNNVYMVGDVKQSIYGFRNANPSLFQEKYNNYSRNDNGLKIDLIQNFRSNRPVINTINDIFSSIMDDLYGQADYSATHQMQYGFTLYDLDKSSNHIQYLTYENDKIHPKTEIENFIIAQDIIKKIKDKLEIYDTTLKQYRPCEFKDFAILIDKSTNFDNLKKILDYHNIPATIFKDEKLTSGVLISVIQNILTLLCKVNNLEFDSEFKKAFYGLARSFLFNYDDETIFDCITNNNYQATHLYQQITDVIANIDKNSITGTLEYIYQVFDIENKLVLIGDIEANLTRLQYVLDLSKSVSLIDQNIFDFSLFLTKVFEEGLKLEFPNNNLNENKVKIMTIHKSKGLEFPICYFPHNFSLFNKKDITARFIFDNQYGIILPYYNDGVGDTIYKTLLKDKYNSELISEKIRLLYVALTRCRQRLIIINEAPKKEIPYSNGVVDNIIRSRYNSFKSIYHSVLYKFVPDIIDVSSLNITRNYLYSKKVNHDSLFNNKTNTKLIYTPLTHENEMIKEEQSSKEINKLMSKEEHDNLEFGSKLHKVFELCDFKHFDPNLYPTYYKDILQDFLSLSELKNIKNAKVYKEYEFIYQLNNNLIKGIIDLMIEYDDYIDIIDYKLKNISDKEYLKQLKKYADFIVQKTKKKVNLYLYSILDRNLQNISTLCYNLKD